MEMRGGYVKDFDFSKRSISCHLCFIVLLCISSFSCFLIAFLFLLFPLSNHPMPITCLFTIKTIMPTERFHPFPFFFCFLFLIVSRAGSRLTKNRKWQSSTGSNGSLFNSLNTQKRSSLEGGYKNFADQKPGGSNFITDAWSKFTRGA